MLHAAEEGNSEKVFELQKLSDLLGNLYQAGRTLGESLWALKFLMQQVNLCEPYVMPPLQQLTASDENKLKKDLEEIINKEGLKF